MSTAGESNTVERVCLNLRVSESVKDAYEAAVAEKYGRKRPYTGTELERELRLALDVGTVTELFDSVLDLADAFGKAPREKKNLSTPNDDTTVVSYRIAEPVRAGIMSLASGGDFSNPGKFVEKIMRAYATGESVDERLIDLTDRIKQATEHEFNDELSATEKRTKAIAAELEDRLQFTSDEFEAAIESVPNISPSNYTCEKYLPRVLDELDATWHAATPKTNIYTAEHDVPPEEERDRRDKPYILMDDSDKRLAIKTDIVTGDGRSYTVSNALDALRNKPQHKEVRELMREIGETAGFEYRKGSQRRDNNTDDVLLVNRQAVLDSSDHKALHRVLKDEQTDDDASTSASDKIDFDGTQWVQEAAESLPDDIESLGNADAVIKNRIVRATTEESQREGVDVAEHFFDVITDEQIAQVRQYISDSTEEAGSNTSGGGSRTEETTIQSGDIGVDEQLETLNQATPMRADGGEAE